MPVVLAETCQQGACVPFRSVLGLAAAGLVVLLLGLATWRWARRARRAGTRRDSVTIAVFGGLAVFALGCLLSSARCFGGHYDDAVTGSGYRCAPWFVQAASPGGQSNDGRPDAFCRRAAIGSIAPSLAEAAGAGLVTGVVVFGLTERRRRFDQSLGGAVGQLSGTG